MPSNASGNRHDASGDGHVHDGNGEEETLLGTAASTSRQATKKAKRAWDGFIDFIFSDNVLEVAVGLTIASQFQNVVQAFVSNILLPPVSLIPGIERNFDDKFVVLRPGTKGWESKDEYSTIQQARDDGAIVLGWGIFIERTINFFILGMTMYVLAQLYSYTTEDNIVKRTVKCRYCKKRISEKAKRCFCCTSWQDGRED